MSASNKTELLIFQQINKKVQLIFQRFHDSNYVGMLTYV
jgi:hypothetical protein